MKLRNGEITVKEILLNPAAKQLMQREFPQYMNNPMLMGMAQNMTLRQVFVHSKGKISKEKRDSLLAQIKVL